MIWATTDIHSCNSVAGKPEKEKQPSRPSNARSSRLSQGYLPTQDFFKAPYTNVAN